MVKQRKGGAHNKLRGHCSVCGVWSNDSPYVRIRFSDLRRIGRKRRFSTRITRG